MAKLKIVIEDFISRVVGDKILVSIPSLIGPDGKPARMVIPKDREEEFFFDASEQQKLPTLEDLFDELEGGDAGQRVVSEHLRRQVKGPDWTAQQRDQRPLVEEQVVTVNQGRQVYEFKQDVEYLSRIPLVQLLTWKDEGLIPNRHIRHQIALEAGRRDGNQYPSIAPVWTPFVTDKEDESLEAIRQSASIEYPAAMVPPGTNMTNTPIGLRPKGVLDLSKYNEDWAKKLNVQLNVLV